MNKKKISNLFYCTPGRLPWVTSAVALLCLALLAWTGTAVAQLPGAGVPWQFEVTGFIQSASLGGANCGTAPVTGALACGTIVVNGHVITVPSNTVVMLPANQLTWEELFLLAPLPYGLTAVPPSTGMAMADLPAPLTTYEAHVMGNVMPGALPGQGVYIAGLIDIAQQGLNSGAGYITALAPVLNPLTGATEMEIQVATGDLVNPITHVRINDPIPLGGTTGRYTSGQSPDVRFTSDPDNPTITAGTGFPHCLYSADIAQCPQANRPTVVGPPAAFAGSFFTVTGLLVNGTRIPAGGGFPDATQMAPLEVGDYITFAGNLVLNCAVAACNVGPTAMPLTGFPALAGVPTANATYISAHTITSNIAIFTQPRTALDPAPKDPAFARIDVSLIGTGGLIVIGANEAVIRTRFEGFSTDPSRTMHMFGIDVPQPPGTNRDWGTIGVDPGLPTGAVKGRWRFRPPCALFGTDPNSIKVDKLCIMNQLGSFLPVTRELRSVIEVPACPASLVDPVIGTLCIAGTAAVPGTTTLANGLIAGQYHAPIQTFIFAENIPGTPVVPSDFNVVPFLTQGGYASTLGTVPTGPLNPWPGAVAPVAQCTPPTANANGPYTVASSTATLTNTVTLNGSGGGGNATTFPAFSWTVSAGTLLNATTLAPTFQAPVVAATTNVTATLTVSVCGASVSSSTTITVNPPAAPTVSYVPLSPLTVLSGTPVTFTATGIDPGGLKVDVTWSYTTAPPLTGITGLPTLPLLCKGTTSTTTCALSFTPIIPLGGASVTIFIQAQATNSAGTSSAPDPTTVTILPPSATLSITSAEYRTGKQRLIINASESVISPTLTLKLAPYQTATGVIYDPCAGVGCTFTNNGAGLYLYDASGAPAPACGNPTGAYATPCTIPAITVKASDGGTASSVLTRIRQ
jgi:hypothetical protein